ncbi:hypothetical protein OsJ_08628 [Oryza sativa Japonica Group]|uniref:Pectinesterase catalytic domain-containing protein n=1 Tax=Oryza sativa subsp. japonica TaxID=39947 RepID=B9F3L4_ORYSJ|nr:hypothetical protein OsJ_08628 [Oryza sativa Japonica Group]
METLGRRRRVAVLAWCNAIAMALALATPVAAVAANHGDTAAAKDNVAVVPRIAASAAAAASSVNVTAICMATPYPSACETALSSAAARGAANDPFAASVQFAMTRAESARALARNLSASSSRPRVAPNRHGLLRRAARHQPRPAPRPSPPSPTPRRAPPYAPRVAALEQFIGTALALHAKLNNGGSGSSSPAPPSRAAFPSWVTKHDRHLLSSPASTIAPDAVVALDGSGTHTSISDAIAAVTAPPPPAHHPTASGGGGGGRSRKVIYVKAGRYEESVSITSKQKDVMLLGDGKGKTVISGHRSVAGGYTTYASATVAAMGSGFIAKGLTIVNSAGPGKGQAVALRVGGDLSVVYNCGIEAYQDTLYVHSNRQFYAADDISGTEDTVTAQGRSDPNQNTGISIHRCRITGAPDLGGTPVYLGRPWRRYSRTVVMGTFLDRSIAPAGWLEWSGQFGLSTLYYGEYGNTGPGAGTRRRVTWSGVHTSMSTSDATRFTVANFIVGDAWLPATGVTYTSGL